MEKVSGSEQPLSETDEDSENGSISCAEADADKIFEQLNISRIEEEFDSEQLIHEASELLEIDSAPLLAEDGTAQLAVEVRYEEEEEKKDYEQVFRDGEAKQVYAAIKHISKKLLKKIHYEDISDLLSDQKVFLVDGDSLLLYALKESLLHTTNGGQMLHCVYICERILQIFSRHGGLFEIVFCNVWKEIFSGKHSILLTRSALIIHFRHNTSFITHEIDCIWSTNFGTIIDRLQPSFMLFDLSLLDSCVSLFGEDLLFTQTIFYANIMFSVGNLIPCVDFLDVTLDVSTLKAFVIHPKQGIKHLLAFFHAALTKIYKPVKIKNLPVNVPTGIKDIRTFLYIDAAVKYLRLNSGDGANSLVRSLLLKCAFLEVLPLNYRAFNSPDGDIPITASDFVQEIHMYMNASINELNNTELCYKNAPDIWQGNMFTALLLILNDKNICDKQELGTPVGNIYIDLVKQVNNNWNNYLEAFPISTKAYECFKNILLYVPQKEPIKNSSLNQLKQLLESTCQLTEKFCGQTVLNSLKELQCKSDTLQSFILRNADFEEKYHWHSKRLLSDEINEILQTTSDIRQGFKNTLQEKRNLRNKQRSEQTFSRYMSIYGSNLEGRPLLSQGIVRDTKKKISDKVNKKAQGHNKAPAKSSKAIQIIQKNKMAKQIQNEEEDKKLFEYLSKSVKNFKQNCMTDNALHCIKLCEDKFKCDLFKHKVNMMKAEILFKKLIMDYKGEANESEDFLDLYLKLFLLLRNILLSTESTNEMSKDDKKLVKQWLIALDLKKIAEEWQLDRNIVTETGKICSTGLPWAQFQLKHVGPHLLREFSCEVDPELGFSPDDWQKKLINIVRKRESVIVIAPTSSGKTYASYYCMKSVLQEGTEGIVIYVSPTKALVNQVAATVHARFSSTVMPPGKAVYGVFTRDYVHNPMNCQILITVPECLELLLLSPGRINWVKKLRYVIFDEIHCISGIAGGLSWEVGLLMIRCPFLALSATVEHPEILEKWLQEALHFRKKIDIENLCEMEESHYTVHLIQYTERHNDLKKYVYDVKLKKLVHIHPYSYLTDHTLLQHKGIPAHISLTSDELLQLFSIMHELVDNSDIEHLVPEIFFKNISSKGFLTRAGVKQYECTLKKLLQDWSLKHNTLFKTVISKLKSNLQNTCMVERKPLKSLPSLVHTLHVNKMLPAIIFSFDRSLIHCYLETMNSCFESENTAELEKVNKDLAGENQSWNKEKRKGKEIFQFKKKHVQSLNLLADVSSPLRGFGIVDSDDVNFIERRLIQSGLRWNDPFVCGLRNGIGIHHAGLNSKERGAVEMLFRLKVLNVVFATSTLALGVHMPCKTVVIAMDSIFLNPLNYHQMSGRAGRRGFDLQGNVVFWGVDEFKCNNLLTGKLPTLRGNFPMSVSLVLRLLLLVSRAADRKDENGITLLRALCFLNCNLVYQHFPQLKQQMKHFFAFSTQLLMVQKLLDDKGKPQLFSGIVTHLHYHEPGNLIFVYLLRSGVLHEICTVEKDGTISKKTQLNLILLLSHLFTNIPIHPSKWKTSYKNSVVNLPQLPDFVIKKIESYNQEVKFLFDHYFRCVAAECSRTFGDDNVLPLSELCIEPKVRFKLQNEGHNNKDLTHKIVGDCKPRKICSAFVALSGYDDQGLYSETNIISNIRHQVFTDMKMVPLFDFDKHLNAYAWDFYNHGIKDAIIDDNGLKVGYDFSLLKDFMLLLKTIHTSLDTLEDEDKEKAEAIIKTFKFVSDSFEEKFREAYFKRNGF